MGEKENKKKMKSSILLGILIGLLLCCAVYAGIVAYIKSASEVQVSSSGSGTEIKLESSDEDTDETVASVVSDTKEVIIEKFGITDDSAITVKAAGNEQVSEATNPNSASASFIVLIDGGTRYTQIVYPAGDYDAKVAAHSLSDQIADLTGYHLSVVSDDTAEETYEVLIGSTNRKESTEALQTMQTNNAGCMVNVTSDKVVLVYADASGMEEVQGVMLQMAAASDGTIKIKKNTSQCK